MNTVVYQPSLYARPSQALDDSTSLTAAVQRIAYELSLRCSRLHTESEHPQGPWLVYCDDELIGTVVCQ